MPTTPEPAVTGATANGANLQTTANAACTPVTAAQLVDLAVAAFGAGSPDVASVIGKIGQLETAVLAGDYVTARQVAFTIIEFTLRKNSQRALGGTEAQLKAFVNAVACYAGLNFTIDDPDGVAVVTPADGARIIYSADLLAGLSLAANTLQETTIFSILPIPFVQTEPGDGPLTTKLDQYRGFYDFQKLSANNLPFLQDLIVGVCAPASLSSDFFARLRLGHNVTPTVFRLEPPANADFLNCATAYTAAEPRTDFFAPGLLGRVAALFTPRVAFASSTTAFFAGGVGGLASELSPFAPVDATLSFAGGVGGLASELRILTLEPTATSCSGTEAPVGNAIEAACRPKVVLTTSLGTPLSGAPVTFTVTVGDGKVALQNTDGSCGTFATSVIATTLADGSAQVCWTLGTTAGRNRLRAVGGIGGDVPAGVTYENARFFTATGNLPTRFAFIDGPAAGANVVAGTNLLGTSTTGTNIPVKAALVDVNGVVVTSFTGQVTLALRRDGAAASFAVGSQTTATAVNGVATFAPVVINAANTGYSLRATGTFASVSYTGDGNTFNVVAAPGEGSTLTIVQGNGQLANAGSTLPIQPTVRLTDKFGNLVSGAAIDWTAAGTNGGSVAPVMSTTNALGEASTTWTIGSGSNELLASYGDDISVLFTATVRSLPPSQSLKILSQCADGNDAGDPFASGANLDPTPTAFYIPDFTQSGNMSGTISEISVRVSAAGTASSDKAYELGLIVQRGTFDITKAKPDTIRTTVILKGSAGGGGLKTATFEFKPALAKPSVATITPNVMLDLIVLKKPAGGDAGQSLRFNTGPCGTGTKCTIPNSCKATQVSQPTPFALGTFLRKSVGITVKGT